MNKPPEDNVKDFLDLKRLKKLASLFPEGMRANGKSNWYMKSGIDAIFADIASNIRKIRSRIKNDGANASWKDKHTLKASQHVDAILKIIGGRRNTSLEVGLGAVPSASKPKTGKIKMVLGHMWTEKVFKTIYSELKFVDAYSFILSAEEYRVKQRFVRIFECKVFNIRSGDTKTSFLVAVDVDGKKRTTLTTSAARAVELGTRMVRDIAAEKITGEENG